MYISMVTKEGSAKIVNFMTPGVGDLMLERGCIIHYTCSDYAFIYRLLYQYTAHLTAII